jgi:2-dehydro-3-deoxyphosphooctonate aldolase (KDO 8-P synthase)
MKLCGFEVGLDKPLFLIAGPCVIESRQLVMDTAGELKRICAEIGIPFIFKSSYDKATYKFLRAWGWTKVLRFWVRSESKSESVLTDVLIIAISRRPQPWWTMLQTPAPVPPNRHNVNKARTASGQDNIMVCEQGVSFITTTWCPTRSLGDARDRLSVVFDATHSVQLPGAGHERQPANSCSAARAAVAEKRDCS